MEGLKKNPVVWIVGAFLVLCAGYVSLSEAYERIPLNSENMESVVMVLKIIVMLLVLTWVALYYLHYRLTKLEGEMEK